jgi:hypothetical protein
MSWNYRVMAIPDPKLGWDGEVSLTINDVYYNDNDKPNGYGELMEAPRYRPGEVPGGATLKEIRWELRQMMKATQKPILCAGDRFPQEYKEKNIDNET